MRVASVATLPSPAPVRLAAIDALRGISIVFIIGGDGLAHALATMAQGKGALIAAAGQFFGTQFTHVEWEGLRFYDLLFPLLIFVVGLAVPLSLTRLAEREGMRAAYMRVLRRAMLLYVLGLIYYGGISQHWGDIRYVGVLQRIAVCYLVASILFLNTDWRGLIVSSAVLLVGYWALMALVPVPGIGVGSYAPDANLANWIDRNYLPGRLWDDTRDPEGLLSTLPAIVTALIGVLAGLALRDAPLSPQRKSLALIGAGIALVVAGHLWGLQFPVIKSIWTSSFVLVSGGYSLILLGGLHQIMDVWGYKNWATIFVWIGANAILLYFINAVVGFVPLANRLVGGDFGLMLDRLVTPGTGGMVAHVAGLTLAAALAAYLYRRKIFLRV